jgi:FkbM family methyltransferase
MTARATGSAMSPQLIKGWLLSRVPVTSAVPFHYWGRVLAHRLEPEVRFVARLVTPERFAIDVGANFGVYTAAMVKAGAKVIAFEPLKECADALRVFATRSKGRLTVHETALSDHAGTATLHLPHDRSRALTGLATLGDTAQPHEDRQVTVRTLDSYQLTNVRLIKIDVEGHEMAVIRGAGNTIAANDRPSLMIEVEQQRLDRPISEVFEAISAFGYMGWFLRGRTLRPVSEFRVERDQPPGTAGVHNFLFIAPKERWRLDL